MLSAIRGTREAYPAPRNRVKALALQSSYVEQCSGDEQKHSARDKEPVPKQRVKIAGGVSSEHPAKPPSNPRRRES